jgi:hypothetical protein
MYMCMYMSACMCMCVCTVCMCLYVYVCMHVYVIVCVLVVYVVVCMYECCMCVCLHVCICVCVFVAVCAWMCVCVCVCVCEVMLLLSFQDTFILAIILTHAIREISSVTIKCESSRDWVDSIVTFTMKEMVQFSVRTMAFLTEVFCDFPEPLQAHAGEATKIRLRLFF